MAKRTKAEAPKPEIGAEIYASLRDLEKLKGIPTDYMVERLKQALTNAYRRDREDRKNRGIHMEQEDREEAQGQEHHEIAPENIVVELDEHSLRMYTTKTVTPEEELEDPVNQISLEAARKIDPNAIEGGKVRFPVDIASFGRIAAQTAKQVIIQGIREAERGLTFEAYSNRSQELMTVTVLRTDPETGDVFVSTGADGSEAVLRASEQIPGETYMPGQLLRVYVLEVRRAGRGPQVQVSRTHPNLVRRLFELETPEVADGQVEIRNIAREPGSRTKMAVRAKAEDIDPVGACVGPRGDRVSAVVRSLNGEKIEIVVWSEDPCEYVRSALQPAQVIRVTQIQGQKGCTVVVPDDQLSLAIGREGQNARLAARLTGYKIDIKPASRVSEEA